VLESLKNADIQHLITTARWFSNLGNALPTTNVVPIGSEQWHRIIHADIQNEFNLPGDAVDLSDVPDFEWLNRALEQAEQKLKEVARAKCQEADGKIARLRAFKWGQVSLRNAPESALLVVGATNLNMAARQAALLTCRVAASEVALETVGVGCLLLGLYHRGHWPFGRAEDGRILVL